MQIAHAIQSAAEFYALAGAAVAVLFLLFGLVRVAPEARGSWAFRPLLVPGLVLLWPLVLWRWRQAVRGAPPAPAPAVQRAQRAAHRASWLALAVLLPLLLWLALSVQQDPRALRAPQQIAPPAPEAAP